MKEKTIDEKLREIAAQDRAALLTERDVEFLRSIGIDADLEKLKKRNDKYGTRKKDESF